MKKILIFSLICFSQSLLAYNCDIYAARAFQQANTSIKLSCGFTGPAWDLNRQAHYNWCRGVALNIAIQQDILRYNALRTCISRCVDNCSQYALRAFKQNEAAKALNCGFSGNRWHSDYNAHYNWCLTARMIDVNSEDTLRKTALFNCVSFPPTLNLDSSEMEDFSFPNENF